MLRNKSIHGRKALIDVGSCLGHVLAEDIVSQIDLPPFDNSAMDGYAVGGPIGPWEFKGSVPAGDSKEMSLAPCEAVRVYTGSRVPIRTYGVIAQEDVSLVDQVILGEVKFGQHLRLQGEELEVGDQVLRAGCVLTPPHVSALAALGLSSVSVRELTCGVITTGDELIIPGNKLEGGQIYNSNKYAVQALLGYWAIHSEHVHVQDEPVRLEQCFSDMASQHDLIITTGGISVGDHDHVHSAAKANGFSTEFCKVAVKPGKPITFGLREDGRRWVGLPGNPLSTSVGMLVFVSALIGREFIRRKYSLGACFTRKGTREEFIPAEIGLNGLLRIPGSVGSHSNTALVDASLLAHLPAGEVLFDQGDEIEGLVLPWGVESSRG